jgi:uncharacterized protein (DUF433 family)
MATMSVPFQYRLLSVDRGAPMIMAEFIALIRGTQPRTRTTQVQLIQRADMAEPDLLGRITINPKIFGGKPIIRGRRLAVEHVLGMLAAGDTAETLLEGYPWLEPEDIRACLLYARRYVGHERIELMTTELDRETVTS